MTYVTSFEQICIDKGMQAGLQAGRQEGLQEGLQAGMQTGMQTGEALALQKLLIKRFGTLPTDTINQITTASTAQIDAWLDRVLDAPSLDTIFGPPQH